ncbi:MAG TPA: hypothetical protein DCS55_08700 [Acidimicrobiaceae bacterium]|nr:hypothetical protein [Acidimicrobiaceae bacterium]
MGTSSILDDRAVIERMRSLCSRSLSVFAEHFDDATAWPYQLSDNKPVEFSTNVSMSTTAMIVHACGVVMGAIDSSVLTPVARDWWEVAPDGDETAGLLISNLAKATSLLVSTSHSLGGNATSSTTWGDDDPLTLLWLTEILFKTSPPLTETGGTVDRVRERCIERAKERVAGAADAPWEPVLRGGTIAERTIAVPHVFPILRILHLRRVLSDLSPAYFVPMDDMTAWLETQLHRHLSYREIANSDFDPAELVFALEGLLLARDGRVSDTLVSRTLDVMADTGPQGGYWRPIRPLRVDAQGSILLPQSVEVANSLLRICDRLDERDRTTSWSERMFDTLREYTEWLEARMTSGRIKSENSASIETQIPYDGWQSDHTHREGLVHLWATSQAALYFSHFGSLAQVLLAAALREENKISVESTEKLKRKQVDSQWSDIALKEPMAGLEDGSISRVYSHLFDNFVSPRLNGRKGMSSILLYGPPGTGKTSFAESLAAVLGFDLISITPSDFLGGGESGVEVRASRVFDTLMQQSSCVVLFDEIDRLLLSRDDPRYGEQSDMFQFMTPSMLTKLNNLRREGRVLFVIATNYEDRIDAAIKRAGRIDTSMLLLPPDRTQRARIVNGLMRKSGFESEISGRVSEFVSKITPLFAYQELKEVCTKLSTFPAENLDRLKSEAERLVHELDPAISLSAYKGRFAPGNEVRGPVRETVYLSYLCAEVGGLDLADMDWLRAVIEVGLDTETIENQVRESLEAVLVQE